jgi:antitoxin MazE
VKAELVRIGNSRGIRLPKPLIEQCHLGDTVEIVVEDGCLVISRAYVPRQGWEEAFRAAPPCEGDPLLLDAVMPNQFDREDWKW